MGLPENRGPPNLMGQMNLDMLVNTPCSDTKPMKGFVAKHSFWKGCGSASVWFGII